VGTGVIAVPFYLGQRYVPGADQGLALSEAERVRDVIHSPRHSALRLVSTTFVPNEEWVFDLFEAESSAAVENAYAQSAVKCERIAEAIYLTESQSTRRNRC
jgi:hypothetical protein